MHIDAALFPAATAETPGAEGGGEPNASVFEVLEVRRSTEPECVLNQRGYGEIVVPGFGASDCRMKCGSHLKREK